MSQLGEVLAAFHDATGCAAAVWAQDALGGSLRREDSAPNDVPPPACPPDPAEGTREIHSALGVMLVTALPGTRRMWLSLGPCPAGSPPPHRYLAFLTPVVGTYVQSALEVEHAASELAERYEEINLLYTTSEILGRTLSLEETARAILHEISQTVGARRASILVHDRVTDTLQVVAVLGADAAHAVPIAVPDRCSVSARVFREQHARIVEDGEMLCEAEVLYRRGAMLSVPIMWTAPKGAQPLGVVNLSDRGTGQPFSAGDQKLISAIATQIGTAIQNARLVRASLNQQSLMQEMQLAHDLQMRLLPNPELMAPEATVAARVIPAESVGGDFYNLFRLGGAKTGAMIGDVSGHGYRAALIMALTMSAAAIHAQGSNDPAETLNALLASVRDELTTTEMFVSAFYGIIDRDAGLLRFANTGHPHAFVVTPEGHAERLTATDPPLGMSDKHPTTQTRTWTAGRDLLVLFTDGISDARNRRDERWGEQAVVDIVIRYRAETPAAVVDHVFRELAQHAGDATSRDDLTLVVLRS
ncbi:MAG: hypothetical protein NVS9B3_08950 [Gemmatimonadaceae bacterium]